MRMREIGQKLPAYEELMRGEYSEKFLLFYKLLEESNRKYNLTAITQEKEVFFKHFLDSVAGESLFERGASVVEVGSGAGFPSVPLKILRDDLHFTLIESTGKKCGFLHTIVDNLGLKNVTVLNMRAEEAGKVDNLREKFDICTARAVARLNTLAEYCLPLVKVGGKMVAYKGTDESEIEEGKRAVKLLGGGDIYAERYELPENMGSRTLVWTKKIAPTPEKYPRGNGKERRNPIV